MITEHDVRSLTTGSLVRLKFIGSGVRLRRLEYLLTMVSSGEIKMRLLDQSNLRDVSFKHRWSKKKRPPEVVIKIESTFSSERFWEQVGPIILGIEMVKVTEVEGSN